MPQKRSIPQTFLVNMVAVTVLSTMLAGSILILQEYHRFERSAAQMRDRYLEARKALLKEQVDQAVAYIEYKRAQAGDRARARRAGLDSASELSEPGAAGSDVEAELQREALDWIERIRFSQGNYVFVGQWDGLSLSGPGKGQNMAEVTDPNGVRIVQSLIDCARAGGGFVTYVMPKLEGQRPEPKLSYARGVPAWGWYVGTGVYIDDINDAVARFRADRLAELQWNVGTILLLLLALCLGTLLFVKGIARRTRAAFEGFADFFQQVSLGEASPAVAGSGFTEFDGLANSANRMVERRRAVERALRDSEERLRILFAQAADAIYVSGLDGRLVQVNRQACIATGYSEEELLGMNVVDVEGEITTPAALQAHFETLIRDRSLTLITQHKRKDGSCFPVEIRIALLDTPDGKRVLGIARDITERLQRQVEYAQILETTTDAFWVVDGAGRLVEVNPAAAEMLGYSVDELKGRPVSDIDAAVGPGGEARWIAELKRAGARVFGTQHRCKDGTLLDVEVSVSYFARGEGRLIAFTRNVTDRKRAEAERLRLEEQLRQAQKMEAIGQLTGGVAHDFNNLLQVINAGTSLALSDLDPAHPACEPLREVVQAGENAAGLVRQLLAFGRRQIMRQEPLDIDRVIGEILRLLQRVIGEHVRLDWRPGTEGATVHADRGMLEQTIMNLCVNARDAMPEGGVLTIETKRLAADTEFCGAHAWAEPGPYAAVVVSDTGCGMNRETLGRIFEPFFSTKEEGKGSGLGLSTVYGIVKQHRGMVTAASDPGAGSTFTLYWPISAEPPSVSRDAGAISVRGGTETILLAEDEEMVRRMSCRLLEQAGYTVLTAQNGAEAVAMFKAHGDGIDLTILDVVMPGMGGREAYDRMRALRPDFKALFASGYSESAIDRNFILEPGFALLRKPYTREPLLRAVRDALDGN